MGEPISFVIEEGKGGLLDLLDVEVVLFGPDRGHGVALWQLGLQHALVISEGDFVLSHRTPDAFGLFYLFSSLVREVRVTLWPAWRGRKRYISRQEKVSRAKKNQAAHSTYRRQITRRREWSPHSSLRSPKTPLLSRWSWRSH